MIGVAAGADENPKGKRRLGAGLTSKKGLEGEVGFEKSTKWRGGGFSLPEAALPHQRKISRESKPAKGNPEKVVGEVFVVVYREKQPLSRKSKKKPTMKTRGGAVRSGKRGFERGGESERQWRS